MSTLEDQPVEAAEPTPQELEQSEAAEPVATEEEKPSDGDEVKSKVPAPETEEAAEPQDEEIQPVADKEEPKNEERSPSPEPKRPPKGKGRLEIKVDLFDGEVLETNADVSANKKSCTYNFKKCVNHGYCSC